MTATDELLDALADAYGLEVDTAARLTLADAFRGRTRPDIAATAADLWRSGGRAPITASDLAAALAPPGPPPPPPASTVGLPIHVPTCQCGGSGVIVSEIVGPGRSARRFPTLAPCHGNGGRRATAEQLADWRHQRQMTGHEHHPVFDRPPADQLASLAAVRARLATPTTEQDNRP